MNSSIKATLATIATIVGVPSALWCVGYFFTPVNSPIAFIMLCGLTYSVAGISFIAFLGLFLYLIYTSWIDYFNGIKRTGPG